MSYILDRMKQRNDEKVSVDEGKFMKCSQKTNKQRNNNNNNKHVIPGNLPSSVFGNYVPGSYKEKRKNRPIN